MKKDAIKRFSLRKLSVGLVPIAVGSVWLLSAPETVHAAEEIATKTIEYRYVQEGDLTEAEHQLITKELPKLVQEDDSVYYLVYRPLLETASPLKKKSVLPSTGSQELGLPLFLATTSLLVVGIRLGKNGKKKLGTFILITSLGGSVLSSGALALSNSALADYNQTLALESGQQLPSPLKIENHQYLGYIRSPKIKNQDQDKEKLSTPDKSAEKPVPESGEIEVQPQDVATTEPIAFETRYQADPSLAHGQTEEAQAGQAGEKQIVKDGKTGEVKSEKVLTAPVTRLIKVGTQPTVTREELDFPTRQIDDENMSEGLEVVESEGQKGLKTTTITYTVNEETGVVTASEPVVETTPAVERVIRVGTKKADVTITEPIAFEARYQADPSLAHGQTEEAQAGRAGEKQIVKDGKTGEVKSERVLTAPVTRLIKVGTQPTVTREELDFPTRQIDDENMAEGLEVVESEGQKGLKTTTITYTVNEETGVVTASEPVVETTPAVERVVRVGAKKADVTITEPIAFETRYQADPSLAHGQTEEAQAGQAGEKQIVKDGKTGEVKSETVLTVPVTRLIKVGTQPTVTREELDFPTRQINDENMSEGLEVVESEGQKGLKTTTITYTVNEETGVLTASEPVVETTPAVERVVRVGTKPAVKTKPVLSIQELTKDEDRKSITVTYQLTDPDKAYVSAKALIYKGDQLVKEVAITDPSQPLLITGLDYYTDYQLKTELSYRQSTTDMTAQEPDSRDFRLDYKKIEFKDIESVNLYEKEGEDYHLRTSLSAPKATSAYYVAIKPSQSKELLLPVSAIEATEKDGQSVYKISLSLEQLVQGKEGQYQPNHVFYIPRDHNSDIGHLNEYRADYLAVQGASPERTIAYANTEKLLPFYNKEYIVHLGNQISASDKLYQTRLIDVVPMVDNRIVTDVYPDKSAINKLMLHYADQTVAYLPLAFKEDFKNNQIAEYSITGTSLLYTPESFISSYSSVVDAILPTLEAVELNSDSMRETLKIQEGDTNKLVDDLYLDRTFAEVKANLAQEVKKVLATNQGFNTSEGAVQEAIAKKIKDNANAFMLGLSYLNRWYNINYGDINVKELSAYKLDFFGNQQVSTLDHIIALGNAGYDVLRASKTPETYRSHLAPTIRKATLFDYVEAYRQLFLPNKTNNEWLKENSKAYMVESFSNMDEARQIQEAAMGQKDNKYSIGIYDRITSDDWEYRNMLLPLLTLSEENMYVISNMSTLSFGGYERYKVGEIGTLEGEAYYQRMHEVVNQGATWQRDFLDFWYRMVNEEARDKLFKPILTYEGFYYPNKDGGQSWRTLRDKDASIQGFFGPVGRYYENNYSGAYATGKITNYVVNRVLDRFGSGTYTHEMTHNFDGSVFFEGYGRREGLLAEFFATGLFEAPSNQDHTGMGINSIFQEDVNSTKRYHAANPNERYRTLDDLKEYMHGMFDIVYLSEYLEGEALLSKGTETKKKWWRKFENVKHNDKDGNPTHASNRVRRLTDEEVSQLKVFNDLIDKDIANRRGIGDQDTFKRNSYYNVPLFSAIYSALSNDTGAPGDVTFKRTAFELLAAKGYREGFLPYVSNMYAGEAFAAGHHVWSSWFGRYVGLVSDQFIFDKILKNEYNSWADFKKAMYQERIQKAETLGIKPITIQYELGVPNSTKTVTISSLSQLREMVAEAVERDMTNIDRTTSHAPASWVNLLHSKVYNAYLRLTDDFRSSIFND
ncbi:ZmpA/ZmpB/ZmpC family metallo-endopeptidase [Streptococcus acidominimus]|uniref:Zinc metalloproteinase C n=1 Tax=Streptococcus acidominimus TaxID=1326 RepID=A0A1Q8EDQ4_STRAI|nr:ZmpA/ZmpB/ZmpC family metallo-endopeptidase [Streptococcus acidominimus]OLF49917.1 hypothetical protein BU200_04905 [Streptococcus acidominimus]SUN07708.1 zinc metalloproteinase C [Streptococcus acidominimus]